jgi:hypothetical protein
MTRKQLYFTLVLVAASYLAMAILVGANQNGPPNSRTGAPGESTCASCHGNLNTGNGSTGLSAPLEYSPGETLSLAVTLQDPGQIRWGFEVTALDSTNAAAGNIIRTDSARTLISTAGSGRQYLKQSRVGCDSGVANTAPGWSFKWAAPGAGAGPVTFYIGSVAANGNDNDAGDFTYTTSKSVSQAACLAIPGDANASGSITIGDIIHLVNYIFDKDKPPCLGTDPGNCWTPVPFCRGDANASGTISIGDVVHLVNYTFDKDNLPCLGSDPGNCWPPVANGVCCQPVL